MSDFYKSEFDYNTERLDGLEAEGATDLGHIDERLSSLESTSATKTSLAAVEARVTATEKKSNAAGTKAALDALAARVTALEKPAEA